MRAFRIIVSIALFPAALLLPAGRIDWLAAWVFMIAFYSSVVFVRIWIARRNPGLLEERRRHAPNVERWDTILMGVYTCLLLGMFVVSSLDSGRFGWSAMPVSVRISGWIGLAVALAIVLWVVSVNPFASRWVRIQDDRGHEVVTAGPYKHVRHPMYVGVIVFVICCPMVLGSWWGMLPGAGAGLSFVFRTALEDRTLLVKLPGYKEYAGRVRYRLLPGVW